MSYLLDPRSPWIQVRQLGGLSPSLLMDPWSLHPVSTWLGVALVALAGLGTVVTLLSFLRRGAWRPDRIGVAALVCLAAVLVAAYVTMGGHALHHGLENNRYLLTGMPFWAVGVGLVLSRLGPLTPVVGTLTAAVSATASLALVTAIAGRLSPPATPWVPELVRGLQASHVPGGEPLVWALLAVTVVGLVLVAASLAATTYAGRRRAAAGRKDTSTE